MCRATNLAYGVNVLRDRLGPAIHSDTAQTATAPSTTGTSGPYEPVAS